MTYEFFETVLKLSRPKDLQPNKPVTSPLPAFFNNNSGKQWDSDPGSIVMKLNKLLIGRSIRVPVLPSAIIHNGYRSAPA